MGARRKARKKLKPKGGFRVFEVGISPRATLKNSRKIGALMGGANRF